MLKSEIQATKYYDRAMERVREKDYTAALSYLEKAIKRYDRNFLFHYVSGFVYMEMNNIEQAKISYQRALGIDPGHLESLWNISLVYLQEQNLTEAIKYWHLILEKDPEDMEARMNMALAYYNMSEPQMAMEEFQEILKIDENNFETHKNMALIFKEIEDFDKSLTHLRKMIEIDPTYEDAIEKEVLLVESLKFDAQLKKMEQESLELEKGTSAVEGDIDSLYEEALTASISGDHSLACEKALALLNQDPGNAEMCLLLFQSNLALENHDEAEQAIQKALDLNPENPEILMEQGKFFMYQKKHKEALDTFEKVKKLDSNFPFLAENITMAREGLGI